MAEAKIDFSFDNLHFSCEGERDWVESQLKQVLNRIPGLFKSFVDETTEKVAPVVLPAVGAETGTEVLEAVDPAQKTKRGRKTRFSAAAEPVVDEPAGHPLHFFLKEKNADKNQVKKFLATTVYLHAQGVEKFSTPMVSKSLKGASIDKLINASDCLNKNEKKGFCIKDGKDFILTAEGIRSILGGEVEA